MKKSTTQRHAPLMPACLCCCCCCCCGWKNENNVILRSFCALLSPLALICYMLSIRRCGLTPVARLVFYVYVEGSSDTAAYTYITKKKPSAIKNVNKKTQLRSDWTLVRWVSCACVFFIRCFESVFSRCLLFEIEKMENV